MMMMALSCSSKCSNKTASAFLLSNVRPQQQQQQHGRLLRRRRGYDYDYYYSILQQCNQRKPIHHHKQGGQGVIVQQQSSGITMRQQYYTTLSSMSSSHHSAMRETTNSTTIVPWAAASYSRRRRIIIAGHNDSIYKSRCLLFSSTSSLSSTTTLDKGSLKNKTDFDESSSSSFLRVIEYSSCSSKRPRSSSSSSSISKDNKKLDHHHHHHHHHDGATVFISDTTSMEWKKQDSSKVLLLDDDTLPKQQQQPTSQQQQSLSLWNDLFFYHVIRHFLPAHYPDSVGPGYAKFSMYAFGASMAGSAAMVLSTQTLLLAVGVVGAQTSTATSSIMAGALNWVVKDGIGQIGGVIFASKMGQSRHFDDNPKRWRMVAAASLDIASFMEILSPTVWSSCVLPVACCANVLKNIGFLTASASRAALHQSMSRAGNLADVTAKSGSQSMAAGLLGTTLGIVLSTTILHQDPQLFIMGFIVLSFFHQIGNYSSLKHVGLNHFNRHRLHLVLDHYLMQVNHSNNNAANGNKLMILTPDEVAHCEVFFPLMREDDADTWLSIASGLSHIAPGGPWELNKLLEILSSESYLINIVFTRNHDNKQGQERRVYLTFLEGATGEDVIKGCLHAYLIRQEFDSLKNNNIHDDDNDVDTAASGAAQQWFHCLESTYEETNRRFPQLLQGLHDAQWKTTTDVTNIESSTGFRLAVNKSSLPKKTHNKLKYANELKLHDDDNEF